MLGDFFLVVTPIRFTSSGSFASATATRFCTSTWAVSMFVPSSNVTSRFIWPSFVQRDDMYNIRSTPFTSASIGVATVSATVTALAPGYVAVTCTVGGVTSGYWAIGNCGTATAPRMTMTIDRTVAKIGRSMKKWDIMLRAFPEGQSVQRRCIEQSRILSLTIPDWRRLHRFHRVIDSRTLQAPAQQSTRPGAIAALPSALGRITRMPSSSNLPSAISRRDTTFLSSTTSTYRLS